MRAQCGIDAYRGQGGSALKSSLLGLQRQLPCCLPIPASSVAFPSSGKGLLLSCRAGGGRKGGEGRKGERTRGKNGGNFERAKGKENVWSIDNDLAAKFADVEKRKEEPRSRRRTRTLKGPRRKAGSRVLVSAAMLMEVETVLQTQVSDGFSLAEQIPRDLHLLGCQNSHLFWILLNILFCSMFDISVDLDSQSELLDGYCPGTCDHTCMAYLCEQSERDLEGSWGRVFPDNCGD